MTVIELNGCRPEPIGSYLKALEILRLVAAQRDGAASAAWRSDHFELRTAYDHDDLVTFFVDDYQPTPILRPMERPQRIPDGTFLRERNNLRTSRPDRASPCPSPCNHRGRSARACSCQRSRLGYDQAEAVLGPDVSQ